MSTVRYLEQDAGLCVKENVVKAGAGEGVLSARWVLAAVAGAALAFLVVVALDGALPEPRGREEVARAPALFAAELAHSHLANLTAMGPRVAGSLELEVLAVGVVVAALRELATQAAPHHRLQWEVWRDPATAAFSLAFLDGMNHVYSDVTSVVARLSPAAPQRPHRPALLLNCHIDTVPDSPGASDDAAGCAVLLETVRALAAGPPLERDVLLLLNGAEENVLQASHAFVTRHRWARRARVFLNVEACGAGGREVLFQAGPRDGWLLAAYAAHAPHPFASSLAHELFASGALPADTDFRIFRDHGALSGLDLAWAAAGHVYHTRLDTAARMPPASLQRTGDNVLAVARALLADPRLDAPPDAAPLPVYADLLGLWVLRVEAHLAVLLAVALVGAALAAVRRARVQAGGWAGCGRGAGAALTAGAGGVLVAGALGLALHVAGARLRWYSRPWLAVVLFAPTTLAAMGALAGRLGEARGGARAMVALGAGCALLATALGAGCAVLGLRSAFVPLVWAGAGAGGLCGRAHNARMWAARWAAWAVLPTLLCCDLALGFLHMFVPVSGRAGRSIGPLPPDMAMGLLVGSLTAWCSAWSMPLWAGAGARARRPALVALGALAAGGALLALATPPYSADTPQRLMVFHTRRTEHASPQDDAPRVHHEYWAPELDVNTRDTFHTYFRDARSVSAAECAQHVYCGLPYYLPVLALLPGAVRAPAPPLEPALRLAVEVRPAAGGVLVAVRAEAAPAHSVVIVRVAGGGRVARLTAHGALLAPPLPARRADTCFVAVYSGRARPWALELTLQWAGPAPPPGRRAQLSVAGHSLFGPRKEPPALAAALRSLPATVAASAWSVDHHLYTL